MIGSFMIGAADSPASSVCSPPPCGEGLGVGVVQLFAGGANVTSLRYPPPQPSPARGEGAHRVRSEGVHRNRGAIVGSHEQRATA
jgi:hypothetical protein